MTASGAPERNLRVRWGTSRVRVRAAVAAGAPLPPLRCRRSCRSDLCSELEEAPGLIGQERAVEALQFRAAYAWQGVQCLRPGGGRYRPAQHGRGAAAPKAEGEPTPPDWCYVNNFDDPQQPRRLQLPPGRGSGLAAAMKRLVEELRAALPAAFERDEYRARREAIEQQFRQRSEAGLRGVAAARRGARTSP